MKLILVAAFSLAFTSCYKTIDSTSEACTSGCTIVEGRVTTLNQQPVAGVTIEITSKRNGRYSGVTRKISKVTSGSDGHYVARFALNEKESGANASSEIHLVYIYDETKYTPVSAQARDIILSSPQSGMLFQNREISVSRSIYLPLKATALLKMTGFQTGNNNSFTITPTFKTGAFNSYMPGAFTFASTAASNEYTAHVAGNDTTRFRIEKWKNGNRSLTDTAIFTTLDQPTTVNLTF